MRRHQGTRVLHATIACTAHLGAHMAKGGERWQQSGPRSESVVGLITGLLEGWIPNSPLTRHGGLGYAFFKMYGTVNPQ